MFISHEPTPSPYLTRLKSYSWIVVATTCIGAFMGQLDASIVQIAMPEFERVFHARISAVSWIATAYLIAFASVLPIFGRLAAIRGRKILYIAGFVLFTGASALCGLASNFPMLVAFRVLQGVGGAMLGANSVAILVKATTPQQRGQAMGLFAAAQAIGAGVGPAFGGVLLDALGWRWIFWANAPLGIVGAVAGYLVFPVSTELDADKRFDWRGALLLTPALISLVAALSEIDAWGPASIPFVSIVAGAAILLPLFVRRELRFAPPLVDLGLFARPAFTGGIIAVILCYAMLYGILFLMSFSLVRGFHQTHTIAGFHLALVPAGLGLTASFSGQAVARLGQRGTMLFGTAIALCALAVLTFVMKLAAAGAVSGLLGVMAGLALFGAGLGLLIAPNNNAAVSAAPASLSSQAAAMLSLTRVFGTSVGVAAGAAMLSWRLEAVTGVAGSTIGVSAGDVLRASEGGFAMVGVFAVVAAFAATVGLKAPVPAPEST